MTYKRQISLMFAAILAISPSIVMSQLTPDVMPATIYQLLNPAGTRLGTVLVAGDSHRGYRADNEYWRFSEEALLDIAEQESLEISILAQGEWNDRWVVEALAWQPDGAAVEWNHPATVEWSKGSPPVVPGGTYFGNATLGGLMVQYSPRGASTLTWFKLTEGRYMLIDEGAVFVRDDEMPETGSWWQGEIKLER